MSATAPKSKFTASEMTRKIADVLADNRSREGFRRDFTVERNEINEEKRTVELSFASETPVERWFGNEVLQCTKDSCDMARLNAGGALLVQHDSHDQIGVVEKAYVTGGKCRAVVRFSRSARAQEMFQDVCDGIRSLVSVGYRVKNMVLSETNEESGDTYLVDSWMPHEISLVSIPADASVGVGRSIPEKQKPTQENQSRKMNPESTGLAESQAPSATPITADVTAATRAAAQREAHRMSEINAIGRQFTTIPQERIIQALVNNEPLDGFRKWVMEDHLKATPVNTSPNIGMNKTEKRRYSMQRAINRLGAKLPVDGLEKEVSDAAAKQYRREADMNGFLIPHDISDFSDREMVAAMFRVNPSMRNTPWGQNMERALFAGVYPAAGALVAEDFLGGSFIELLRNKTLLTQLGVGTLSGLVGNVAIPRQSGAATAYWLAEGESVTATDQAFSQVASTPRRLAAQTAFTKQLLAQSSLDAEALIRDDLMRVIAIAKDLAGIAGTGGSQPLGILNGPTSAAGSAPNILGTVTFGAAPTWANVVAFENAIETGNADIGTMQWLSNPTVKNKWKTTVKVANYPVFLIGDDNRAAGYPMNVTNQIATTGAYANRAIFGAWGQAMFMDWAGMDVVVDPYTQAASNKIVVTLNMFSDFIVRHWPSFAVSTDSGAQ
jgi:HK97 family phage major capsid protein